MDPGYFDQKRERWPREKANLLSIVSYWYTWPVFAKGRKSQLSIADVYETTPTVRAAPRGDVFADEWKREMHKKEKGGKASLLRVILKVHGLTFIMSNILFAIVDCSLRLAVPLCLEGLISYFSPLGRVSKEAAFLYAAGLVGFTAISALLMHPMLLFLLEMSLKIRVASCSLLYRKLLRLDTTAGGQASEGLAGHFINLLTTDSQRFDMASLFLVDLVRTPIECSIVVYLMYRQIGAAALVGVAFLLLFIPLQGYLGNITSKLRNKTAQRTDNRIRLMNEVIESIEAIKMYVWENAFEKIIGHARRKEMDVIKKMAWMRAVMISCVKLNTKVAIFISIIVFTSFNNELTAAKVFVLLFYYNILKLSLVDFLPLAITFTLEAYVSVKRMQEFLLLPEVNNNDNVDLTKIDGEKKVFEIIGNGQQAFIKSETALETSPPGALVSLSNYSAHWSGGVPALIDVNLAIKPTSLTTVVGQVGSGKTTLLLAMLRELHPSGGTIQVSGIVAYAKQDPWLFGASVRQNILFGLDMDLRRYKQVIKCCQLKTDLEILPHGDKTVVGDRGASLSGGQRARIALARCVYQQADVYLLDDPLSAVDAKVAQAIFDECISGFLREKAVVLVTHHVHYASKADNVCVMKNGRIVSQGTYKDMKYVAEFEKLLEMRDKMEDKKKEAAVDDQNENMKSIGLARTDRSAASRKDLSQKFRSQRSMSSASQLSFNLDLDNNFDPDYEGEVQTKGSIDNSVYFGYIKSGGNKCSMFILFGLFIIAQVFYGANDVWLKDWVNIEEKYSEAIRSEKNQGNVTDGIYENLPINILGLSRTQCVYIYGGLVGVCVCLTWHKLIVFYNTCIRASIKLHDAMFNGVVRTSMSFFHHNPGGRVLNRFSRDLGQVDTLLPMALLDCLGFFLEVVSFLIVVCLANWWLILPTSVITALLLMIRQLFLNTSRELKRIEAIARSQSLNHAQATVSGLPTIRSAKEQQITVAREFDKLQDLLSSSWLLVLHTNRAFGLWTDMICCLYLAAVTLSFLLFADGWLSQGGNVGLAITQVIGLVGMCQFGMRQTAEVENQMTSVERILEYSNLPPEGPMEPNEKLLKQTDPNFDLKKWPAKGDIVFESVYLEYEKPPKVDPPIEKDKDKKEPKITEPNYALRDVSFSIKSGEKVAVVGRTGAGKSSLIAALFQLAQTSGNISICSITPTMAGKAAWRAAITALPQRPALFAGTIRDNLDPYGKYSDGELWAALREVGLQETVQCLPGGLYSKTGDGGASLSAGQRQLMCLTRGVTAKPSILVLDEATANVDSRTDHQIQATIRTLFASSTVLTIAHRLNTVMDYDRVIVMDKGRVVESGHPYELLNKDTAAPRRTLLSKSQAPLAIPEEFPTKEDTHETLVVTRDRVRTYSSRSEPDPEGNIFKTLVEQTGRESAAMLYDMAEQSYHRFMEKKKNS